MMLSNTNLYFNQKLVLCVVAGDGNTTPRITQTGYLENQTGYLKTTFWHPQTLYNVQDGASRDVQVAARRSSTPPPCRRYFAPYWTWLG